ncbi:hypothetical protein [Malonomonas rubra]|uniref:hypothetical protein n=1 Tax=Malonomonas rubra TaxID=57040 RepID=UPI0026E9D0D2|nr:hypothetical protein [Malonomonas rubra]
MAKYSLSVLESFLSGHSSEPFWIGLDVHKRTYHLALLKADDKKGANKKKIALKYPLKNQVSYVLTRDHIRKRPFR